MMIIIVTPGKGREVRKYIEKGRFNITVKMMVIMTLNTVIMIR